MDRRWGWFCSLILCWHVTIVWAGGSGLNVVVVVNQNSTNSVQLGNYYSEKRQVPPQNYLRINWPGGNSSWTNSDFNTNLLNPLVAMLGSRQLTNQVDFVVLSMDIPYQLFSNSGDIDSTTSALYYGFKTNGTGISPASCSLPASSSNSYAGSEGIFRSTPPGNLGPTNVLAMMITGTNLAAAKLVVDQGVLGDSTFPTQTVFLGKSPDTARNIRYLTFDTAIFNTRLRGNYSMVRTNVFDPANVESYSLGFQEGEPYFSTGTTTFTPGAMADNLTSYGGLLFLDAQTTALAFLAAGAAGSYGTVVEPCAYLEKFPSPQNYFYQARGLSRGACYYQSIKNPYQGLLVGEPLSAAFGLPASGSWSGLPVNALLSGTTNLALQFNASDASRPVQQVDLFVDGTFAQTLTNTPPRTNNIVYVTVNGFPTNYVVPAGATIKSVASNLTVRLGTTPYTNSTKVAAFAHGDRIELQSLDRTKAGGQVSLSVSNSIGTGTALTTFLRASGTNFLDTVAYGIRGFQITGDPVNGTFLQVVVNRTNNTPVSFGVTNSAGWTLTQLTQALLDLMNTNGSPSLQGPDGLRGEDLVTTSLSPQQVEFNLRAGSVGWDAAQIQAGLNGSAILTLSPSGSVKLDENVTDLEPRSHVYVTAGVTNLPLGFAFNTTSQPDGYHELTAVAYEGSHVRTQGRVTQNVRIQNSSLSATFTTLFGGSNSAVGATLQFAVVANTNNISKIELFSTGGSLTNVTGVSNATFSIAGTNLGIGLHPFYAMVTGTNGKQYRTETTWIRLIVAEPPFSVSITSPPPVLIWPATAGRHYDILSATNPANTFQVRDGLTPSNSTGQWAETNASGRQRFYRIQTTN